MKDVLTVEEIIAEYPREWVLIGGLVSDETTLEPLAGTVLYHGPARDEAYQKAIELRPRRFTVLFTGPQGPTGDVWVTPFVPSANGRLS